MSTESSTIKALFNNGYFSTRFSSLSDSSSSLSGENLPVSNLISRDQLPIEGQEISKIPRLSYARSQQKKIGHCRVDEKGEITYKRIHTFEIMKSLQSAISYTVGNQAKKPERDLLMQDFTIVETTAFVQNGSQIFTTIYGNFLFKAYAPVAFCYFRDLFGIDSDDFLWSLCSEPMYQLSNPGASGSIFYISYDDQFIMKTVQNKERKFLQKLLPGYYMNLNQNPRTLLPKYFGLYCYQHAGRNVRVVVMNNILPTSIKIHQKYDLKGSTYKRTVGKCNCNSESQTFKDLDFMEHHPEGIFLDSETYNTLIETIQRDCRVLESFKIMDYSLLVGIHNIDEEVKDKKEMTDVKAVKEGLGTINEVPIEKDTEVSKRRVTAFSIAFEPILLHKKASYQEENIPQGGIPARNMKGQRLILYLGIIDILQSYHIKKKLEHAWKSLFHNGDTISVHKPKFYAQRFQSFLKMSVFKRIPTCIHQRKKRRFFQQTNEKSDT